MDSYHFKLFPRRFLNSIRAYIQGELELHPAPSAIKHQEIGKYFERFDGRRYIPNAEMKAKYPEDDSVALSLLQSWDESQVTFGSSISLLSEDNKKLTEERKGKKTVSFSLL